MTEPARDDEDFKATDTLPSADSGAEADAVDEASVDRPSAGETAGPDEPIPPEQGEHAPGDVVAERYEILEVLGRGVSGTVYRARDLYVDSGHEIVALKAIHAHLHTDRQIRGRFRREVEILSKLEGPHLCRLLECVEEDGLLLIALEYVDGPSLDTYVARHGPLANVEIVAIVRQICAALDKAHATGIVHRDLKPSNVLIEGFRPTTEDGDDPPQSFLRELSVKVVDFGLAKVVVGDGSGTALTEQDMIFGTPDYMAPEQVSGDELDKRCDVYAAGVILYELLVGAVPFDTPSPLTTMAAHLNEPVPVASRHADRPIGEALDAVLEKALAKKPDDRYPTAGELAEALDVAVGLLPSVPPDTPKPDTLDEDELD
ncbi:MAG: serine/threonine-protein kinase, partial [Polyangiaceae bacterium]